MRLSGTVATALAGLLLFASHSGAEEDLYFQKSNQLIDNRDYSGAEAVMRDALADHPRNLEYRSHLGFCLMKQGKHDEAEREFNAVLTINPNEPGALWYRSVNVFHARRFRASLDRFDAVLPLVDTGSPRYWAAHWYVGSCLEHVLRGHGVDFATAISSGGMGALGITQAETDRMIESFRIYLKYQPDAPDRQRVEMLIEQVRTNRPPANVERWVMTQSVGQ